MCLPKAPKAPDPVATANAQNQVNQNAIRDTANVNQINEITPFGSRTYTGSYDTGDRTVTDSLSPELQNILASQLATTGTLSSVAQGRAAGIPTSNFSLDGSPKIRTAGDVQFMDSMGTPSAFGDVGKARRTIDSAGEITRGFGDAGQIQRKIDRSGVSELAGLNDFGGERNRVEDALYNRGSRRVNEQYGQDLSSLQAQLAAQGITQGSTAYDREMSRLARDRNDALTSATEGAIINAGQEQGRLFGQSLAARGQTFGEAATEGGFVNQAQGQNYGQLQGRAQFANNAQNQQFNQNADQARFYNEGQAQDFGQDFSRVNADRDWAAQNANFGQDARQRQFNAGLSLQDADMQNRQNSINENILSRNQNLNELVAMLSGSPISPQGQLSFQPRAQYNPAQASPDAVGTANSNYSAASQARAAVLGSIFGAAGAAGGAAARCWVAREVYGAKSPRWLMFRDWLDSKAPAWFRNLYIKFGERFAAWISDKPKIKSAIRSWMDARIA